MALSFEYCCDSSPAQSSASACVYGFCFADMWFQAVPDMRNLRCADKVTMPVLWCSLRILWIPVRNLAARFGEFVSSRFWMQWCVTGINNNILAGNVVIFQDSEHASNAPRCKVTIFALAVSAMLHYTCNVHCKHADIIDDMQQNNEYLIRSSKHDTLIQTEYITTAISTQSKRLSQTTILQCTIKTIN